MPVVENSRLILLPGMDGTGELFAPLLKAISPDSRARVLGYPADTLLTYDELYSRICSQLQDEPSIVLLAESFSGPLAIRYAAEHPERVKALVLCATFARLRLPTAILRMVPSFPQTPVPGWMLRGLLLGSRAPQERVDELQRVIRRVDPRVLMHRLEEVSRVDVRNELRRIQMPALYLAGRSDRLIRARVGVEMKSLCPKLTIQVLAGPHLLLQIAPELAWRHIEAFVKGIVQ